MAIDPQEIFAAGRLIARQKAPYFRAVLLGFAPVDVPGLGTIGVTEHGVLMLDWEFIARVTPEECAGLLVHAVMHVCLEHCRRARRAGRDRALSNQADDLAINPAILDMGLTLPTGPLGGLFPEKFGFPRGLSSDEYYDLLRQKQAEHEEKQGKKGEKGSTEGSASGGAGGEGEPDEPSDEHGEGGSGADADHQRPGDGDSGAATGQNGDDSKPRAAGGWCGSCAGRPMPGEPDAQDAASRAPGEMDRMTRQVAEAVRDHASKARGTVPGMLQRWADEIMKPVEIPWQTKLGHLARAACAWRDGAVQHRYDAPSRRQAGIGFGPGRAVLPRLRMPTPNVTVIIDTSGSMSSRLLGEAARETNGILKAIGAEVTLCTCDAAVTGVTKARTVAEACARLKGGGGTDMRPAFDAVMKSRPRPDVIVCVTDGYVGDGFPRVRVPGVRTIIVLVGDGAPEIPNTEWAETVRVESAKKSHAA